MDARATLVVMTRNRWGDLRRTLRRHEGPVLLVDNGSVDGTPELVRRHFPDVAVVELGTNRGAPARNVGVERASTPYVAFADDDSWWEAGAIDRAADVLDAHPDVGLVSGQVLVGEQEEPDPVTVAQRTSPLGREDGMPAVLGFPACAAVVRRSAYLQAGGFDPVVFFAGEEDRLAIDLATRDWRMVYLDEAVVHHLPSPARCRAQRHALSARNRVLTAVMRRPWRVVATTAAREVVRPGGVPGLAGAVPRLPRALARRRVVPHAIEQRLRLLDR